MKILKQTTDPLFERDRSIPKHCRAFCEDRRPCVVKWMNRVHCADRCIASISVCKLEEEGCWLCSCPILSLQPRSQADRDVPTTLSFFKKRARGENVLRTLNTWEAAWWILIMEYSLCPYCAQCSEEHPGSVRSSSYCPWLTEEEAEDWRDRGYFLANG